MLKCCKKEVKKEVHGCEGTQQDVVSGYKYTSNRIDCSRVISRLSADVISCFLVFSRVSVTSEHVTYIYIRSRASMWSRAVTGRSQRVILDI